MVNQDSVEQQLKRIDFNPRGWNRSEVAELQHIILPDEQIYECVNGLYEGGFALLVATDVRVLLVDKKPLSFLNVEDLRFDMINEIDYNHRMMGANIIITTGSKTLNFRSYNKERLRKLIGHVQHCMAETKKKESSHAEGQNQHLEQLNNQLQAYLVTQYKQQQKLQEHLAKIQAGGSADNVEPPKLEQAEMSSQLKDYLYANGLMEQYRKETGQKLVADHQLAAPIPDVPAPAAASRPDSQLSEIYADGLQEVFGGRPGSYAQPASHTDSNQIISWLVDPLKVAISKLPEVLRSRKFGLRLPPRPAWPAKR